VLNADLLYLSAGALAVTRDTLMKVHARRSLPPPRATRKPLASFPAPPENRSAMTPDIEADLTARTNV
jgi:hypothetical protein